jgi:predicted HTH domain antitoxin
MYEVEFMSQAEADLSRLDKPVAQRILKKIRWLSENKVHPIGLLTLTNTSIVKEFQMKSEVFLDTAKVLLAEKMDEKAFARELRILVAVKLHELGRLASGRAAELAGMSRVEFLLSLNRYKVFPLEAELEDLERQHAERH